MGGNDKKFNEEYLKNLEKNQNRQKNKRKEWKKKCMKRLEKSLEWNERDEQMSKRIWKGQKGSSFGSRTLRGGYCYRMLEH